MSSSIEAMNHATALAAFAAIDTKVLIITTSKQMSEDIGLNLQSVFKGWDGMMLCHHVLNGTSHPRARYTVVVTSNSTSSVSLTSVQSAQIIVGTSCAGTGLDIFGVAHIIVVGLPFSIEQLLQWAGRCRSDGNITVIVPSSHFYTQEDGDLASKHIYQSGCPFTDGAVDDAYQVI